MPSNATRPTWNFGKGKQRSENKAFVLFIYLKLPNKNKNSDLENLISFSVIYRFIGLRHEITEICSINRKHRSNWTVTLKEPMYFLISVSNVGVCKTATFSPTKGARPTRDHVSYCLCSPAAHTRIVIVWEYPSPPGADGGMSASLQVLSNRPSFCQPI